MSSPLPVSPAAGVLRCTGCRRAVATQELDETGFVTCPVCSASLRFTVFPRLEGAFAGAGQGQMPGEDDATCTFYPELRAETICEECGCFLSTKAAVDWAGRSYCMPCLHHLREGTRSVDFQARTVLPENRALALTWFLLPVSFLTAPIALFLLFRHRKASRSFVPRGRVGWWFALVSALLVTVCWTVLFAIWTILIVREFQ